MSSQISGLIGRLAKRQDLLLVTILVLIIFMMILRLPPVLMDVLIAINMSLSVVLLLVAIYLRSPTDLSTLPTVLLIATLFRLSISISTTRLILLEGNAGNIVETFGQFVVSGNLVVGLVVFLIITIVQFLVITKGSERVAEVSARFTLDAMPGKQMSIDADMRGGVIDIHEAKLRRKKLEKESQLFGAMDGAMKFVKGDAIAGLIITAVNILGGMAIGVAQQGMPLSEALEVYSILTIGDGLVSQIPALFLSVATGAVVTRVQAEENADLGTDIGNQLVHSPQTLQIAGIVLVGFALVPGFPTVIFLLLAVVIGGAGYLRGKRESRMGNVNDLSWADMGKAAKAPIRISLGMRTAELLSAPVFHAALSPLKRDFLMATGLNFPEFAVDCVEALDEDSYHIELEGVSIDHGRILPNWYWFAAGETELALADVNNPENNVSVDGEGLWVHGNEAEKFSACGLTAISPEKVLAVRMVRAVQAVAHEFLGVQETRKMLDELSGDYGELVDEALKVVPLQKTTEILKRLVAEGISVFSLRRILEALVEWGNKEKDPILLSEYVRASLSRQITSKHTGACGALSAILLTPEVEDLIRESTRKTAVGSYLVLPPDKAEVVLGSVKQQLASGRGFKRLPVVLASMDVRRHFRALLENEGINLSVLSYQEIEPETAIVPRGIVALHTQ